MDWDLLDKLLGGPINKGPKVLIITNPIQSRTPLYETFKEETPGHRWLM